MLLTKHGFCHKKPYQSLSSIKITPHPYLKTATCNNMPQNATSSIKASGARLSSREEQLQTLQPLHPAFCPLQRRSQKSKAAPSHQLWLALASTETPPTPVQQPCYPDVRASMHLGNKVISQICWFVLGFSLVMNCCGALPRKTLHHLAT